MIDFAEDYYYGISPLNESEDILLAQRKAFSSVLPIIIENDLTKRQSTCFRFKYMENKTQDEIARALKLSQPTVSRHINTAKEIINDKLKYCYIAVSNGIDEYERLNTPM